MYTTRLASNEIFSPSNKIHREVGRAKDLAASRYWKTPAKENRPPVLWVCVILRHVFSIEDTIHKHVSNIN
jgi:hypothetical protein